MMPIATFLLAMTNFALFGALAVAPANPQNAKEPYPAMAPLEKYLIADRDAEIALARSAAPESISRDAEVLVLSRRGYESAVKGKNGFVCIVQRSWTAGADDPDFWNPKLRAPICFNPPAARSYLPLTIRKTDLVLAGRSKQQMVQEIESAIAAKQLPTPEPAAMCYMLSKQGYLGDQAGHWHPHLMFFTPLADVADWGAGAPASPVLLGARVESEKLSVFLVPVARWSDGTPDSDAPVQSEKRKTTMTQQGRILGIGGIFFKSANQEEMKEWYAKHLGLADSGQGVMLPWREKDNPENEQMTVWSIFPANTKYFEPSPASFMMNYLVDDLDALLDRLAKEGVRIDPKRQDESYGRFAWIYDPDGNKIELWQPVNPSK